MSGLSHASLAQWCARLKEMISQGRVRTDEGIQFLRFQEEFAGQLAIIACPKCAEVTFT